MVWKFDFHPHFGNPPLTPYQIAITGWAGELAKSKSKGDDCFDFDYYIVCVPEYSPTDREGIEGYKPLWRTFRTAAKFVNRFWPEIEKWAQVEIEKALREVEVKTKAGAAISR